MNRKNQSFNETEVQNGEYAVRRSRRFDVIALVVCLLLAFIVWIVVMGNDDTDHIALSVVDPADAYVYTLSDVNVEVKGTVAALRHTKEIGVLVEGKTPGVYQLTEQDLDLPDGIHLTEPLALTLTVKAK